jgi:hypothetical protein
VKSSRRLFALTTLFALGLAFVSALGSSRAQDKEDKGKAVIPTAPVPKWEYKVALLGEDDATAEKELNKLGEEGWELVGTPSRVSSGSTGSGAAGAVSTKVRLIFKRPKK